MSEMICYIKDRKTFRTKHMAQATCDVVLHSIYDEVSTITLPARDDLISRGDFVYLPGEYIGIINEIDSEKNLFQLTCGDVVTLFSRSLPGTGTDDSSQEGGIEAFIKRQIDWNYTELEDSYFRIPFLKVEAATTTREVLKPDEEKGLWNIRDYLSKARNIFDIFTDFFIEKDVLRMVVSKKGRRVKNVDLSMPGIETLENIVSAEQAAKISVLLESGDAQTLHSEYYLLADGTFTEDSNAANRVEGTWDMISVNNEEDIPTEVKNRFAQNSYSHLIEFASREKYDFYDKVLLRTKEGKLLHSYISAVCRKSEDDRFFYKTGELRNMLDEKLNIQLNGR